LTLLLTILLVQIPAKLRRLENEPMLLLKPVYVLFFKLVGVLLLPVSMHLLIVKRILHWKLVLLLQELLRVWGWRMLLLEDVYILQELLELV
jgi:hypothetical protein